jgi:nitroreductase
MTNENLKEPTHAYETVKDLITSRHTFRSFQSKEIPEEILRDAFALAQLTPSNNNLQTWRAVVVRGEALTNLKNELQLAWAQGWPVLPPIPDEKHSERLFTASIWGSVEMITRRGTKR